MFMYVFPALFGIVVGLGSGFFLAWLELSWLKDAIWRSIGGALIGTIFGAIIGSISGDPNASTDQGGHRVLIAGFFGALGGWLGATKLEVIWMFLRYMNWPSPV
jgi:hypothetical protein